MAFKQLIPAAGAPSPASPACADGGDPRQMFWDVIAHLKTAKAAFGLKDRHFSLLQALVSFVRERGASGTWVVFASNEKLCERANGMGERTMRRQIARLIETGLLRRTQSPNGKRYVHRARDGRILQAYGFDLGPLLERAREIAKRAAEAEEEAMRIRLLRDRLSTLRRQWPIGSEEDDIIRLALRRRLTSVELDALIERFTPLDTIPLPLPEAEPEGEPLLETEDLSSDAGQNVRHHQRSIPKKNETEEFAIARKPAGKKPEAENARGQEPELMVSDVLAACPEAVSFAQSPVQNWMDLHALARFLAPMLGLQRGVLDSAEREMGQGGLTLTLLAMTQMHNQIRSPGAYLRSLAQGSAIGHFDPVRLIRNLGRKANSGPRVAGLPG
ncbi:plasmid replication protein RepC (plasmid) [Roseobacteraceae bacterium NS-SX3]